MTRHLLKLVWNRKRSNALMILETCVSFLVVFAVATLGLFFLDNYRQPLGFEWKDVWAVGIGRGQSTEEASKAEIDAQRETFERLQQEVRSLGPVVAAAGSAVIPFDQGGMSSSYGINGKDVRMDIDIAGEGFDKVMGLRMVAGRWFEKGDGGQGWNPIVIDRDLARAAYGAADPVGKSFGKADPGETPMRVIGVVNDFRKAGELMPNGNFMFQLQRQGDRFGRVPSHLLVRVRPGT